MNIFKKLLNHLSHIKAAKNLGCVLASDIFEVVDRSYESLKEDIGIKRPEHELIIKLEYISLLLWYLKNETFFLNVIEQTIYSKTEQTIYTELKKHKFGRKISFIRTQFNRRFFWNDNEFKTNNNKKRVLLRHMQLLNSNLGQQDELDPNLIVLGYVIESEYKNISTKRKEFLNADKFHYDTERL